ncbi:Glyoxalase-like domain protein [Enhygromyxa salina]|uniref:Glyoxalase-like domain protein n=1 Tax=Enhygromyxa salina TaxID=215803 RepID=A0A2S9XDG0_9BACT|nr:VOC family protein [Enhygromyxa salina]PRP90895.1 Glyoxalase-like domain protein [Enhygromyxa salina]
MATKLQNPTKLFPMFITDKVAATRAFYVDKLGWTASYDTEAYLQVRSAEREGPEIAFMAPDAGPSPMPSFAGAGVVVSVPVDDADEHYASARERGLAPVSKPEVKPWGWRSYALRDPNGVILDFFHVAAAPAVAPS